MKWLKAIITFLWAKKEANTVSEPITDTAVAAAPVATADTTVQTAEDQQKETVVQKVEYDLEEVLAKLKQVLIAGGHDIEASFDKAVDFVKSTL